MQDGRIETVRLLLAHDQIDANVATTDDISETPPHVCSEGHAEIVRLLLAHDGIDAIKAETDGNTPLHVACLHRLPTLQTTWRVSIVCQQQLDRNATRALCNTVLGCVWCKLGRRGFPSVYTFEPAQLATQLAQLATHADRAELAEWLNAAAGWPQLQVAAGCRLYKDAASPPPKAASGALSDTDNAETGAQVPLLPIEIWLFTMRFFELLQAVVVKRGCRQRFIEGRNTKPFSIAY